MSTKAIHLGDGAYASIGEHGELFITANHHEPSQETDTVCIDRDRAQGLIEFIEDEILGVERQ